jgi:hypothetical protein
MDFSILDVQYYENQLSGKYQIMLNKNGAAPKLKFSNNSKSKMFIKNTKEANEAHMLTNFLRI